MKYSFSLLLLLSVISVKAQFVSFSHQDSLLEYLGKLKQVRQASTEAYFAALYLQTTQHINRMCAQNRFHDSMFVREMMLDFGNRFSYAVHYKDSLLKLPLPWSDAFNGRGRPITEFQRLALAINAHINHDLGETLFSLYPQKNIRDLEKDFMLIDEIFDSVGTGVYQRILNQNDWTEKEERILSRNMKWAKSHGVYSRKKVFEMALIYAGIEEGKKQKITQRKNRRANRLSGQILKSRGPLKKAFHMIQETESPNPEENITRWFGT